MSIKYHNMECNIIVMNIPYNKVIACWHRETTTKMLRGEPQISHTCRAGSGWASPRSKVGVNAKGISARNVPSTQYIIEAHYPEIFKARRTICCGVLQNADVDLTGSMRRITSFCMCWRPICGRNCEKWNYKNNSAVHSCRCFLLSHCWNRTVLYNCKHFDR